tara:strand:+ start:102 stop:404 length:303 start_codon:yes stop_codon:yes gene_type:complete
MRPEGFVDELTHREVGRVLTAGAISGQPTIGTRSAPLFIQNCQAGSAPQIAVGSSWSSRNPGVCSAPSLALPKVKFVLSILPGEVQVDQGLREFSDSLNA